MDDSKDRLKKTSTGKHGAGFFNIDRRNWSALCDLQSINHAVAYLTVACGTNGTNGSSSWSAKAVSEYTDMDRRLAGRVIKHLVSEGFLCHAKGHTTSYPRYALTPWAEVSVNLLEAKQLVPTDASDPNPERIWLPNTLVMGTSTLEAPPIARLRHVQDVWALRLLIDLYHAHDLPGHGGVRRDVLWQPYDREQAGECWGYTIWAFKPGQKTINLPGPMQSHALRPKLASGVAVWETIDLLEDLGLLYFVPHLVEGKDVESGVIHGCSLTQDHGEPEEKAMAEAAGNAGRSMLKHFHNRGTTLWGSSHCVPARNTSKNIQMIGVARLRYRPHTQLTAEWYGRLQKNAVRWVDEYRTLEEKARATLKLINAG